MKLLLGLLLVFAHSAFAKFNCDLEMSDRTRVATSILDQALSFGAIAPERLGEFAGAQQWSKVSSEISRNENGLALKLAFEKVVGRMSARDKDQLQLVVKELLKLTSGHEQQIYVAKEQTAEILVAKDLGELSAPELKDVGAVATPVLVHRLDGRPVFKIMTIDDRTVKNRDLVFDSFNPNPKLRITEMDYEPVNRNSNETEFMFQVNGEDFIGDLRAGAYYSLTSRRILRGPQFGIPREKSQKFHDMVVVKDGEDVKLIVTVQNETVIRNDSIDAAGWLMEYNLSRPEEPPRTLGNFLLNNLRVSQTSRGPIVSGYELKSRDHRYYNVRTREFIAQSSRAYYDRAVTRPALVFEDEGHLKSVYGSITDNGAQLIVHDLETNSKKYFDGVDSRIVDPLKIIRSIDGSLRTLFRDKKGVVFVDLRTLKDERALEIDLSRETLEFFEFQGKNYLIWQSRDLSNIRVFDVESRQIVLNIPTTQAFDKMKVIEFAGRHYLVGIVIGLMPQFYQLTGRESH